MSKRNIHLAPGLYFVATPIGTARDITLRALDILTNVDILAAEDTRSLRKLMDIHGVALNDRPILAYHDHNGARMRPKLMQYLQEGRSVAYASEAGTPLIADPGFDLSKTAAEAGVLVTTAPGPSAVITALTLAGLPTDRFLFEGFVPNAKSARLAALRNLLNVPATLVFYESPKRLVPFLQDACAVYGENRQAAYCRELTKKFEDIQRGTLAELLAKAQTGPVKGEIVVIIDRAQSSPVNESDIEAQLKTALQSMSVRDAAEFVAQAHGVAKRKIYQMALNIEQKP